MDLLHSVLDLGYGKDFESLFLVVQGTVQGGSHEACRQAADQFVRELLRLEVSLNRRRGRHQTTSPNGLTNRASRPYHFKLVDHLCFQVFSIHSFL